MRYTVSGGTLNPTHSLTHSLQSLPYIALYTDNTTRTKHITSSKMAVHNLLWF